MGKNDPLVSIIVTTYGQENYIGKALDSILMQKVNFKYEIIVGEDCSPDDTRTILKAYERKHPDKFVMIYRDKNMGILGNNQDLDNRCKGKYIAYLEGDDFWISEDKLQKQVDFLETHDGFIATAHNVKIVDKHGNEIPKAQYPECKENLYTLKHYQKGILPGQTASIVMRNIYKEKLFDYSLMAKMSPIMPGDRVKMYLLASHGNIYCFQNIMSAYRHVIDSGTSYSATHRRVNALEQVEYYKTIVRHSHEHIKNNEAIKTIESLYFSYVLYAFLRRRNRVKFNEVREAWENIRNRRATIQSMGIFMILLINKLIKNRKSILGV